MDLKKKRRRRKYRETWLILSAMFLLLALSGCQRSSQRTERQQREDGRLKVVTTLFPYYDFTRQIAGETVELSMVIPAGMDSHSFEPTPSDIRLIQSADVLICNGGAMEYWVEQVLDSIDASQMTVVTMMDHVDVVEEELVEGMEDAGDGHDHGHEHAHGAGEAEHHDAEAENDHEEHAEGHETEAEHDHDEHAGEHETEAEHEHDHDEHAGEHEAGAEPDHDHDHAEDESQYEIEYDEHIWTSPVNAMKITEVIADTLADVDPKNAAVYEAGKKEYLTKLDELDQAFRQVVAEADFDIIIMGDKFPLRYFADEYGLRYRAAFSGCSTDTEPSAKTIAYLIDKVREEGLPAVYYLELSSHRVAEIIGEETGAKPLLFHSCHNVTRREFESGVTYLELMEQNVQNLREGLGG